MGCSIQLHPIEAARSAYARRFGAVRLPAATSVASFPRFVHQRWAARDG
jgi:hypothetical protein